MLSLLYEEYPTRDTGCCHLQSKYGQCPRCGYGHDAGPGEAKGRDWDDGKDDEDDIGWPMTSVNTET